MSYPVLEFEHNKDAIFEFITLAVRMKLDLTGCKISLQDWKVLSQTQRRTLHDVNAETDAAIMAFKSMLSEMLSEAGRHPLSVLPAYKLGHTAQWITPWDEIKLVAPKVFDLARKTNIPVDWSSLSRFSRYVLWYLAEKSDTVRFQTAVQELTMGVYDNDSGRLGITA